MIRSVLAAESNNRIGGAGLLFSLAIIAVLALGLVAFVGAAGQQGGGGSNTYCNTQNQLFCLEGASNSTNGGQSIKVCAGTTTNVSGMNFWYNGTGPYNWTNANTSLQITGATIDNGTIYSSFSGFNNGTGKSGCVSFTLNKTHAPFTTDMIQVNATAYNNTDYGKTSTKNRSMFTMNYLAVRTKSASGQLISSVPMFQYDSATGQVQSSPLLPTRNAYFAEHCVGVVDSNNVCRSINTTNITDDTCTYSAKQASVNYSKQHTCIINSSSAMNGIYFAASNASGATSVQPGQSTTLTFDQPAAVGMPRPVEFVYTGTQGTLQTQSATLTNASGDTVYKQGSSGEEGGGPSVFPYFIEPLEINTLNISVKNIPGHFTYPTIFDAKGMNNLIPKVVNTSDSSIDMYTVIGKVVNESGAPVENVVVYAQNIFGGGGGDGISFINSSLTDSNGIFSMQVPKTQFERGIFGEKPQNSYKFLLLSNKTGNDDVPKYFPTVVNNDDRGFMALKETTAIPPLTIKTGGRVDVNTTLNGATKIDSTLMKLQGLGTGVEQTAITDKFVFASLFGLNAPSQITIPLLSPTTQKTNATVNLLRPAEGGGKDRSCYTSANVSQGQATTVDCNLTQAGKLNLTVSTCDSIFGSYCDGAIDPQEIEEDIGNFFTWFENTGIIRNASNGQRVTYLNNDEPLQEFTEISPSSTVLHVLLDPGTYTLELQSPFGYDLAENLDVFNRTNFTIQAGSVTDFHITRGRQWTIEPLFTNSLSRSTVNDLRVKVKNASGGLLTDNRITVNGRLLYLNESTVNNQHVSFTFTNNSQYTGFNASFTPTDQGIAAGKYWLLLNATNTTGQTTFTTERKVPVRIFDFQTQVDMGGSTFGTGENVTGQISAFDTSTSPPTGKNITTPVNATLEVLDPNGNAVSVSSKVRNITNGDGSFWVEMPATPGRYQLMLTLTSDDGTESIGQTWVQISDIDMSIAKDKSKYAKSDTVSLTVTVENASTGAGLANASVEAFVDGSDAPTVTTTDASGEAVIDLSPGTYGNSNGKWGPGFHSVEVRVTKETQTNILDVNTFTNFQVRGVDVIAETTRPVYEPDDNVSIDIFVPPGNTVNSITATVDGNSSDTAEARQRGEGFWQVDLGTYDNGHHTVELAIDTPSGTQTTFVGFDVSSYILDASLDRYEYTIGDNVTVSVSVSDRDGSAVTNQQVNATLFKAQSPTDIVVSTNNTTTNADGEGTIQLTAEKSGFNYVQVEVQGQTTFVGLEVSGLQMNLLDGIGGNITNSYESSPGSTAKIYVNATNTTGGAVPDGSRVSATLFAFGDEIRLPPNSTTNGNASLSFDIPSFAPTRTYTMEVKVVTPQGKQGVRAGTLTVTGNDSLSLNAFSGQESYQIGDTATFTAELTYENGTGLSNRNVTFAIGTEDGAPTTVGTALTASDGTAAVDYNVTTNNSEGNYFLHAFLTDSPDIQAYGGFAVSNLQASVETKDTHDLGSNITLNVTLRNKTSNSRVNATSALVSAFTPQGSRTINYDPTNETQPYQINVSVPNDASAAGTYSLEVSVSVNSSSDSASTLTEARNQSKTINISVPQNITAGEPFLVNLTSDSNSTASLNIYSPDISQVAYENSSVPITGNTTGESRANTSVNVTVANPGAYVFKTQQSGIGTASVSAYVQPSSTQNIDVWTGTDVSSNTTSFNGSDDVYVKSNVDKATAIVMTKNTSSGAITQHRVALNSRSSGTHYGVLNHTKTISGQTYFVRLDTEQATGAANTVFKVS